MKISIKFLFIFSIFISLSNFSCVAQKKYSSNNKRAINFLEDAQVLYERRNYEESKDFCLKALDKDPEFLEAIMLLGYLNLANNDYQGGISQFEKIIKIDPLFFDGLYMELGILYFMTEEYEKSKKYLSIYLNEKKPSNQNAKFKAESFLNSAFFASEAIKNPVPFNPENLGPGVNSELKEYLGVVSTDQNMIVFTRTIPDASSPNGFQEDFYVSYKTEQGWSKARNMGNPLNTEVNEGGHSITADGKAMVFTICEVFGNYGEGRFGLGSCDLFVSRKTATGWSSPKNLGPGINSPFFDSQPAISTNGSSIYFSSTRKGGYGKTDIYKVEITANGVSKPVNLGPIINTPGREEGVFLHPDGKTLYFSSTGHPGMGGADIFMSKMNEDGTWGKPVNLGYPINTSKDEIDFTVDALGEFAYFTSDREGGYGDWDIYRFKLPENIKPTPVMYMKGIVYDQSNKDPLNASFELIDLETKKVVVASESLEKTGEFLVCLPTGKDYALNVSKDGYLFYSENFTLKQTVDFSPYEKDVPLSKPKVGNTVVLNNIFFDTDKFELKKQSESELEKLLSFLNNNKNLNIEIGGHTDNQGSIANNNTLSQNRAKAVYDYLINNNIDPSRLSFKGYGSSKPISDNDTDKGRALNRRTEFKIIGF